MSPSRWNLLAATALILAGLATFLNGFSGVFVFDDQEAIVENPTIRDLGDPAAVLRPPFSAGQTVGGRPFLNFTFALNYAVGGLNPAGYHAVNLAIHIVAGLLLFGIVRRTLPTRFADPGHSTGIAFAAALLWMVHPLQTESVTYIVQRAESLMGMLYLLSVYGFVRGIEGPSFVPQGGTTEGKKTGRYLLMSVAACFFGMATKEVMVSAPVIVLLYDRFFVSGTLAAAWRARRGYYLCLASTWLLLALLVISTKNRGGSMGPGLTDVSWWSYALTQFPAIAHYLRLTLWPSPLIFDYGAAWIGNPWSVLPAALLVGCLVGATLVASVRRSPWGFLGLWFFAILSPTSLVPANRQTISEHRMYLALAPMAVGAAAGIFFAARRAARTPGSLATPLVGIAVIGVLFGSTAFQRNKVYRSEIDLWMDTVAKRPGNPHAHGNLGRLLARQGRLPEAKLKLEEALRIEPALPDARGNLGNVLFEMGFLSEALDHYREAVRLTPDLPVAHSNLGRALAESGDFRGALAAFDEALRLDPAYQRATVFSAMVLGAMRRYPEAEARFVRALEADPADEVARMNYVSLLSFLGRGADAQKVAEEGMRQKSQTPGAAQ